MLYIFAAIAISAFLAGFGVSHQIDKAEIQHMSDGITAQNLEALEFRMQKLCRFPLSPIMDYRCKDT